MIPQPLSTTSPPQLLFVRSSNDSTTDENDIGISGNQSFFSIKRQRNGSSIRMPSPASPSYTTGATLDIIREDDYNEEVRRRQREHYHQEEDERINTFRDANNTSASTTSFIAHTDYWHSTRTMKRSDTFHSRLNCIADDFAPVDDDANQQQQDGENRNDDDHFYYNDNGNNEDWSSVYSSSSSNDGAGSSCFYREEDYNNDSSSSMDDDDDNYFFCDHDDDNQVGQQQWMEESISF